MKSELAKFPDGCVTLLTGRSTFHLAKGITPFQWLPLILLCAAVIGCAGLSMSYEGTPARPDNRQPLATSGGGSAVWQSKDMALHYESLINNGVLEIKGTVERFNAIKKYSIIDYFRVSIHFLNTDGVILGSHLLWSAGSRVEEKYVRWTFAKQIPIPDGAAAVGFSYRGGFSDSGGSGSSAGDTNWEIWERP